MSEQAYVLEFTLSRAAHTATPATPVAAGCYGDHRAARVRFLVTDPMPGRQYRLEVYDGGGGYDITELLDMVDGVVECEIPLAWTVAGIATLRLAEIVVANGTEQAVYHYPPVRLQFESCPAGDTAAMLPRWQTVMTEVQARAQGAATAASLAQAAATQAATAADAANATVAQAAVVTNTAQAAATQSAAAATQAATAADRAAETVQELAAREYLTPTDYATADRGGAVKVQPEAGLSIDPAGLVGVVAASEADIDARTHRQKPLVPATLDYAVRSVGDEAYAPRIPALQAMDNLTADGMLMVPSRQMTLLSNPISNGVGMAFAVFGQVADWCDVMFTTAADFTEMGFMQTMWWEGGPPIWEPNTTYRITAVAIDTQYSSAFELVGRWAKLIRG